MHLFIHKCTIQVVQMMLTVIGSSRVRSLYASNLLQIATCNQN